LLLLLLLLQVKAWWKVQGDVVCLPLNAFSRVRRAVALTCIAAAAAAACEGWVEGAG
jgi:hypothetical protein